MICSKCGTENRDSAKFCNECGNKLEIACSNRGTFNPPTSKFCDECGPGEGRSYLGFRLARDY